MASTNLCYGADNFVMVLTFLDNVSQATIDRHLQSDNLKITMQHSVNINEIDKQFHNFHSKLCDGFYRKRLLLHM